MNDKHERIPQSYIEELAAKRRNLVKAQEENDVDLDALADSLYPDTGHLIFELLQNAEDAKATSAFFELSETKLSFVHDGRPFSKQDLDNITNYFKSAKYEKEDMIGRFGIGFKSVFGCTETPKIYSDTVAFRIVDRIVPEVIPWPERTKDLSSSKQKTVVEIPFNARIKTADDKTKTVREIRKEIRSGLERMTTAMSILHLRSIERIRWRTYDGDSGRVSRSELDRHHLPETGALAHDGTIVTIVQVDLERIPRKDKMPRKDKQWFLLFREPYGENKSVTLDVAFELQEKSEKGVRRIPGERFRIVPAKRGSVAAFFPAEKEVSNLRFHLHAPFVTALDRASIKELAVNDSLFKRLAELVAKKLPIIRDMGFLDREFLGVLPNSQDSLFKAYETFQKSIVQAMRKMPLVPMKEGGHDKASCLIQGKAELKDFLSVSDILFLMSGWDKMEKRSSVNPSGHTYSGWAVSATQKNSRVDHFLNDLNIYHFNIEHLAPALSQENDEIKKWLDAHSVGWHRFYYSSLDNMDQSRLMYKELKKRPIIRTSSGEYVPAADCRFEKNGEIPEGVVIVDSDIYSNGKHAKRAKIELEKLGVKEIDDEARVVGILKTYYSKNENRPVWKEHRNHVKLFIKLLVEENRIAKHTLDNHGFSLLDRCGKWRRPCQLYGASGLAAPYYQITGGIIDLNQLKKQDGLSVDVDKIEPPSNLFLVRRHELHERYCEIDKFDKFAESIGVSFGIPIVQTECKWNPEASELMRGVGKWGKTGIDIDWFVPHLKNIFNILEEKSKIILEGSDSRREEMAKAIWFALYELEKREKQDHLKAIYRLNQKHQLCRGWSQLVFTLRDSDWIPQKQDESGLVFVKPREARQEQLPKGFPFDSGWVWVKSVKFGDRNAKTPKTQESQAEMGEADRFMALPYAERKLFWDLQDSKNKTQPKFPPASAHRLRRATKQAKDAPARKNIQVKQTVVEGEDSLKKKARTRLRANYEKHACESLCQVMFCNEKSFKLKGGIWYFEAVRFLAVNKSIEANYIALCPRHAAMYQHANESKSKIKQKFIQQCKEFDVKSDAGMKISITLAGENLEIVMAPKHVVDLYAVLKTEGR